MDDSPAGGENPVPGASSAAPPEFEAEVTSLRPAASARQGGGLWTARGLVTARGLSRRQRLARAAGIAGAVALAAAVVLVGMYGPALRRHFTPAAPQPLVLDPASSGILCASALAWSPDGTRLAVAGFATRGCARFSYSPAAVVVYALPSGRPALRFRPEVALLVAIDQQYPGVTANQLLLREDALLWSPDGRRLALVAGVTVLAPGASSYAGDNLAFYSALVLTDTTGHGTAVLAGATAPGPLRWDLPASAASQLPALRSSVTYRWQGETLSATAPLLPGVAGDAIGAGPPGNPTQGDVFTIWQPGALLAAGATPPESPAPSTLAAGAIWNASIYAWSRDGNILTGPLDIQALVVRADQSRAPAGVAAPDLPPDVLRARDAALQAIVRDTRDLTHSGWALAWRPDGQRLAAYAALGLQGSEQPTLRIYACASGQVLATFAPPGARAGAFVTGASPMLMWAPAGARVALLSPDSGTLTIWDSALLPR
ncbi:MAG: hypothetical protein ACHQ4H_11520 [Ktedonobacterales bacterium]